MLLQVHFDTPTASGSPTEPSQLPFPQCCKTVTSRGHTSFASADHETESAACALYTCGKAARQCRRSRYCHTILHSEHSHDILLLDNEQSPIFFTISVTNPKVRGFLNGKLSGKKTIQRMLAIHSWFIKVSNSHTHREFIIVKLVRRRELTGSSLKSS